MPRSPRLRSGPAVGVAFLGGIGGGLARSEHPYPRPGSDAATIRRYFGQPNRAPRISAAGQLLSAGALTAFSAGVARLAGREDRTARAAAVAGGGVAAAALGASGALTAALTLGPGDDDERAVAMHRWAFLAGGPLHGAAFGLLLGALGLAGRRTGELPPALSTAALATAVPNLLSPLYLVTEPAAWLIPIGRFPGLIVCAIAGARRGGAR